MGAMNKLVYTTIGITVSIIVIATILAPQIAEVTGDSGALADYAGLLGAVLVMCVLGALMMAVRLISSKE